MERFSGAAPPPQPGGSDQDTSALLHAHVEDAADGISIVALTGELDVGTIPRMQDALTEQLLQRAGVLVDLSGLTFIDSSGIGVLIHACRSANGTPVKVVIRPDTQVARVFEIARIEETLDVFSDRTEALAVLGAGAGRASGGRKG